MPHRGVCRLLSAALVEHVAPIYFFGFDRLRVDGLAPGLQDVGRSDVHRDEEAARL